MGRELGYWREMVMGWGSGVVVTESISKLTSKEDFARYHQCACSCTNTPTMFKYVGHEPQR